MYYYYYIATRRARILWNCWVGFTAVLKAIERRIIMRMKICTSCMYISSCQYTYTVQ